MLRAQSRNVGAVAIRTDPPPLDFGKSQGFVLVPSRNLILNAFFVEHELSISHHSPACDLRFDSCRAFPCKSTTTLRREGEGVPDISSMAKLDHSIL